MKKKSKTKIVKTELKMLNLKISDKDRAKLLRAAKLYAKGNMSAWLRYAGSHYIPKKSVAI